MSQVTETIKAQCDACGAKVRVPASAAGKRAKCPKCGQAFRIAAAEPVKEHSSETEERIRIECGQCGAALKVPAAAIGRRVKCRKCEAVITVADPNTAVEDDPLGFGQDDSLLDDLAGGDAVEAPPIATSTCPKCGAAMSQTAALCMSCGHNRFVTSSGGGGGAAAAAAALSAAGGLAKLGGRFGLGCTLSAIGALVGGVVWVIVAFVSNYEIGWIAIGVGALAGSGMHLGYRETGLMPALIASGMAVFGIVAAKVGMVVLLTAPLMMLNAETDKDKREFVTNSVANELVEQIDDSEVGEVDSDEPNALGGAKWDLARKRAEEKVAAMNQEEIDRRMQEIQDKWAETAAGLRGEMYKYAFSWIDILFFALAIGAAFKIGANGFGSSS